MNPFFPPAFIKRYEHMAPKYLLETLATPAPKSFRVNTIKTTPDHIKKRFEAYGIELKPVKWSQDAFISSDPRIGKTMEHAIGHVYVQDLTSMIPPILLAQYLSESPYVIDGCAAPGSKTTQLAALLQNRGTILANEQSFERTRALQFNLEKMGALNTIVTCQNFLSLQSPPADGILLDVPCSMEGTVRKDPDALRRWSEHQLHQYAQLQKKILLHGFDLLCEGGTLVYSTCTFAPEENEEVIQELLNNRPAHLEPITLQGLKTAPGITEWNGKQFDATIKKTSRVWPQENDTGGFFVAQVKKP